MIGRIQSSAGAVRSAKGQSRWFCPISIRSGLPPKSGHAGGRRISLRRARSGPRRRRMDRLRTAKPRGQWCLPFRMTEFAHAVAVNVSSGLKCEHST